MDFGSQLILLFFIWYVSIIAIIVWFLDKHTTDTEKATIGIGLFLFLMIFEILYFLRIE